MHFRVVRGSANAFPCGLRRAQWSIAYAGAVGDEGGAVPDDVKAVAFQALEAALAKAGPDLGGLLRGAPGAPGQAPPLVGAPAARGAAPPPAPRPRLLLLGGATSLGSKGVGECAAYDLLANIWDAPVPPLPEPCISAAATATAEGARAVRV